MSDGQALGSKTKFDRSQAATIRTPARRRDVWGPRRGQGAGWQRTGFTSTFREFSKRGSVPNGGTMSEPITSTNTVLSPNHEHGSSPNTITKHDDHGTSQIHER